MSLRGQKIRYVDLKMGNWTDLDQDQVDLALDVMTENQDTIAYFGINGYFICSDKETDTMMH